MTLYWKFKKNFKPICESHSTHFQVGGDNPTVEGGPANPVCKTKTYYTFTLTFSFLKTK